MSSEQDPLCTSHNEESGPLANNAPLTDRFPISPRLMNYVMIPHRSKQFIYHVNRARDQYSIAEAGLLAGGKERKEGR